MSKLSPLDINFWTMHSDTTAQIIASFLPLESEPDFLMLKAAVLEQLPQFPRFQEHVVRERGLHWRQDPKFSLNHHVQELVFPEARTIEELRAAAADVFSTPILLDHSPWALSILKGNGVFAALFRVHHALADGLGALEFFHRLCRVDNGPIEHGKPVSGGKTASAVVKTPPRFGTDFRKSVARLRREWQEKGMRTAVNGPNSSRRQFSALELPFDELRKLRRVFGTSVNDLMLSFVAGSVERYQHVRNAPVEKMKVLLPFNLRRRNDTDSPGNHLTGVGVWLPTSEMKPKERLEKIRDTINRLKMDGSIGAFRLLALIAGRLPEWLRRRLGDAAARRTNFICTNMPGPERPLYLAGAKILGNYGYAALLRDQGIGFAFLSYAGKMCVGIVSDPAIVPHPEELVSHFMEAFEEVRQIRDAINAEKQLLAASSNA